MLTATSNVEQLRIEIVLKIRFKSSIKPFPLVFVHPNIGFSLLMKVRINCRLLWRTYSTHTHLIDISVGAMCQTEFVQLGKNEIHINRQYIIHIATLSPSFTQTQTHRLTEKNIFEKKKYLLTLLCLHNDTTNYIHITQNQGLSGLDSSVSPTDKHHPLIFRKKSMRSQTEFDLIRSNAEENKQ